MKLPAVSATSSGVPMAKLMFGASPALGVILLPMLMPSMPTFPAEKVMGTAIWQSLASWTLAALPLFIWMGEILYRTRLSEQMFDGLSPWLSKVPGRLMHTTILGCGIFGSVSGSSAATCATIAKVALPELERRGYNRDIALGSLAAAGGLGILIPPSIVMVIFAVATGGSVALGPNGERVLSTECSLCQTCITVCAKDSLKLSFGFDLGGKDLLRERESVSATAR